MTSRPSRPTSDPVTRPSTPTRPTAPLCQLWTCHRRAPKSQAHGVRHGAWSGLPRVPTHRRHPIEPAPHGLRHPRLGPAPRGLRHHKPLEAPNATSQRRWGGFHPKPPRCSPFGDENGVQFPWAAPHCTLPSRAGEDASSISRAGGTPGWLWNLRPGSLDWISHPDNPPDGSSLCR